MSPPENDRYIRLGTERWTGVTPFDPLSGLALEWRQSKKGNLFLSAQALGHKIVISVYPSRYQEGRWLFGVCVDDGAWQSSPEKYDTQEDAQEAGETTLRSTLLGLYRDVEDQKASATNTETPMADERPNDPPTIRRIRL